MKAIKFGGTSMACAANVKKVIDIISSDRERRFVVVSAPGKTATEGKVTDMLIAVSEAKGKARFDALKVVRARFLEIEKGLGLDGALDGEFDVIEKSLENANYDYIVSRGEYLSAKLLAVAIDYEFVDAAEVVRFNGDEFDSEVTNGLTKERLSNLSKRGAVIPGFYGANEKGEVKTFSRGGSDVSGAIIARAVDASIYENWTDVDGFMIADPRIVNKVRTIGILTYNELRELAYMGANVLHPESIFPVRKSGIPIHILNTFNPGAQGTLIVPTDDFLAGKYKRPDHIITGIAGKRGFNSLRVEKSMMNAEVGFAAKLLACFAELEINVEHIPSGIDTMTVVYPEASEDTQTKLESIIKQRLKPDLIELERDIALIAVVGHGMTTLVGSAARVIDPISRARINIRMLDQGSSEMNIILGVRGDDYTTAIKALAGEFIND